MTDSSGPPKIPLFQSRRDSSQDQRKNFKNFFLIFGSLILIGVVFSWSLGRLVWKNPSPDEVLPIVFEGPGQGRRAAIGEWAFQLQSAEARQDQEALNKWRPRANLIERLQRILRESIEGGDSLFLSSVVTVLAFSQEDKEKNSEIFLQSLQNERVFSNPQLGIYLLLGLARLEEAPSSEQWPILKRYLDASEPSIRKALAFTLGALKGSAEFTTFSRPLLYRLLRDPVADVRWNAAFSLLKQGDQEAEGVLIEILERAEAFSSASSSEPLTEELLLAFSEAFKWLKKDPGSRFQKRLEKIAKEHPSLKVRQKALEVL